ncbi:MAG: tRNA-dependent cyclodipeptide synthase [Proteobacteria bacterium]|nr:tRNA-dependent cyclodipeptide synthase [Pseudomonadota bacterium]
MNILPCCNNSKKLIEKGDHALLLLSPWNSYFKEDNIEKLWHYGSGNFNRCNFIIFDKPSIWNLKAFNYDAERIEKRVRKEINCLFNRVIRVLERNGLDNTTAKNMLLLWHYYENSNVFLDTLYKIKEHYEKNKIFKEKCLNLSKEVISNFRIPGISIGNGDPFLSVNYLLEEMPFYINAPKILNVPSSVWFYHKPNYFFDNELMTGKLGIEINPYQGGAVINF